MTYSFEFASVDGMRLKYTKEILEPVVKESLSMAQVLRKLGKRQSGGNHFHVKKVIEKLGIDTSHFTGKLWNKGSVFPLFHNLPEKLGIDTSHFTGKLWNKGKTLPCVNPEDILVLRSYDDPRTHGKSLEKALISIGRKYQCVDCGLGNTYNDKPIKLQVDHENGKFWDNREENLNFRCPNCHSQTNNFSGRSSNSALMVE